MEDWSPPNSVQRNTHSMSESDASDEVPEPASQVAKKGPKAKKPSQPKKTTVDKAEKAALREKAKMFDPKKCVEFITTIFGVNLRNTEWGNQTIAKFEKDGQYKFRIEDSILGSSCIAWEMNEPGAPPRDMEISLICWNVDEFVDYARQNTLISYFLNYRKAFPNHRVILAVLDLTTYINAKRTATRSRHYNSEDAANSVLELELRTGVSVRNFNSSSDLTSMISHFVKSLSKLPSRERNESLMTSLGWNAKGENKSAIRVDNDLNGLGELWNQHLCQFNLSSLSKAKAISEVYPTPLSLVNAYNDLDTETEKELLLQNLKMKKRQGAPGPGRIGPELSKKVYRFLTVEDENALL